MSAVWETLWSARFIIAFAVPMLAIMAWMWWLHRRSRAAQRRYREASAQERQAMDRAMDANPLRAAMGRSLSPWGLVVAIVVFFLIQWLRVR